MASAMHRRDGKASLLGSLHLARWSPSNPSTCLQPVPNEPMPHRCLAAVNRLGNLRDGLAGLDQHLQVLPRDTSPRHMLSAMRRLQPMFLDPVADRRFMQIEAPADLRQRQTLPEKLL